MTFLSSRIWETIVFLTSFLTLTSQSINFFWCVLLACKNGFILTNDLKLTTVLVVVSLICGVRSEMVPTVLECSSTTSAQWVPWTEWAACPELTLDKAADNCSSPPVEIAEKSPKTTADVDPKQKLWGESAGGKTRHTEGSLITEERLYSCQMSKQSHQIT